MLRIIILMGTLLIHFLFYCWPLKYFVEGWMKQKLGKENKNE